METAEFIIQKVAPLFNKQGYVGTSMAAISEATGLTKGAVYCNFENKEDLAIKAFEANIKFAIEPLFKKVAEQKNSIVKLKTITNYQRNYYDLVVNYGGCPLMRVGIDSKFNNPLLYEKAQKISNQFLIGIRKIIENGVLNREILVGTEQKSLEKTILSIIEGSSFLAFTHNDKNMIMNSMDYIDNEIIEKIKV